MYVCVNFFLETIKAIGDVVADGYYLKEGFKKKAQEYDESLGISKGVKDTVAAVDSTLGLSTMLGQASTFVSGQFKKIDEQAGLSKIATTAVSEANDLVNVVSENSYVSSTFSLFRGWGSSIAKAYNAIYNESAAAIEARQKEEAEEEDKEVVEEENNNGNDGDDEKDSTDEKEGVNCTKTN